MRVAMGVSTVRPVRRIWLAKERNRKDCRQLSSTARVSSRLPWRTFDAIAVAQHHRDAFAHRRREPITILVRKPGDGNRLKEMYVDAPRTHTHGPLRLHVETAVHDRRHDRRMGTDRQHERTLLERAERVARAARPLGQDADPRAVTDLRSA